MAKPRYPMGGMGGNMNNMIKQAQKMQQEMMKMQNEIEEQEFESTAGGGVISVKMTGTKQLVSVDIKPEAVDPDDVMIEALDNSIDSLKNEIKGLQTSLSILNETRNNTISAARKTKTVLDILDAIINKPELSYNDVHMIFDKIIEHMCHKHINKPIDKVYKRSIIEENHIRFHPDLCVGEDRTFNIVFSLNVKKWCTISDLIYWVSLENGESLSRQKRDNLDDQIRIAEEYLFDIIEKSNATEKEKNMLIKAIHFDNMRAVYTKAKYLRRNDVVFFKRLKELNTYCKQVNKQKFKYPPGKFCTLISLPVRLKLTPVLDAMAWVLTR